MSIHKNPYTGKMQEINGDMFPEGLLDDKEVKVPPYDMTAINGSLPNKKTVEYVHSDNIREGTIDFILWLSAMFQNYHTLVLGERNEIREYVATACKQLLNAFYEKRKKLVCDDARYLRFQVRIWIENTKMIAWQVFLTDYVSINKAGKQQGTFNLFEVLISTLDQEYNILIDTFDKSATDGSSIIPYNLWGDNYYNLLESIDMSIPLTIEEQCMVQVTKNKEQFFNVVNNIVDKASHETKFKKYQKYCIEFNNLINDLFSDYIKRLKANKVIDEDAVFRATLSWEDSTTSIIYRCFIIQCAFFGSELKKKNRSVDIPCKDGDNTHTHEKLMEMCNDALNQTRKICRQFKEDIAESWPKYSWSLSLKQLDIQYDDLYNSMKQEKFFASLGKKDFKICFEVADFKPINEAVRNLCGRAKDGKLGCIKYMVSELGNDLGDEWFTRAAESISNKTGQDAKNEMRNHTDTEAIKAFSPILHKHIPGLSYRDKVKRRKD